MFNLGGMEILVILVVALIVLGPEKLPRVMRSVGKAVGELRRASTEFQRTMNTELAIAETKKQPEKTEEKLEDTPKSADAAAQAATDTLYGLTPEKPALSQTRRHAAPKPRVMARRKPRLPRKPSPGNDA